MRLLRIALNEDSQYLDAIQNKDLNAAQKMINRKAREKGYALGPVFHGTVYGWDGNSFKGKMQFFSEKESFARDYANQKSQEGQMDADIVVRSFFLLGRVFDPRNETHIKKIYPLLPDVVETTNSWGFGKGLPRDEWVSRLSGEEMNSPMFSEEDLRGIKPGDLLPDNDTGNKPKAYQFLGFDGNSVLYTDAYTVEGLMQNRDAPSYLRNTLPKFTKEEVIEDLKKLRKTKSDSWLKKKYLSFERRGSYRCMKTSRYPLKTLGQDTWGLFEGDPKVVEALLSSGFRIIKMSERRKTTYATLSSNQIKLSDPVTYDDNKEIIVISKRFNPGTKDFRY